MKKIIQILKDRRKELLLQRRENHIRLSELDKIERRIKEFVVDKKLEKPDNWVVMNLIIMDISAQIDEAYEKKETKKEIIEYKLKEILKQKKISNEDMKVALDILEEIY